MDKEKIPMYLAIVLCGVVSVFALIVSLSRRKPVETYAEDVITVEDLFSPPVSDEMKQWVTKNVAPDMQLSDEEMERIANEILSGIDRNAIMDNYELFANQLMQDIANGKYELVNGELSDEDWKAITSKINSLVKTQVANSTSKTTSDNQKIDVSAIENSIYSKLADVLSAQITQKIKEVSKENSSNNKDKKSSDLDEDDVEDIATDIANKIVKDYFSKLDLTSQINTSISNYIKNNPISPGEEEGGSTTTTTIVNGGKPLGNHIARFTYVGAEEGSNAAVNSGGAGTTCTTCGGTGYTNCHVCNGLDADCANCDGTSYVECSYCKGTGKIE